jgi:SAM-dependent methyltransferase
MGQTTTGVRAILSVPTVYEVFQRLVGSPRVRRELVDRWIRPRPGLRILDIGCGPGVLVEHLPGAEYTGTDLSASYIAAARRRYGDRGTFHLGRVEDLDPGALGEFDVVVAKSVIHHIDTDEALHLFEVASSVLADGGRLVTLDAAYTPDMSRAARFVVSRDRGQSILAPEGYEALARRRFADVAVEVHHGLLRIPYTHVFMSCGRPRVASPTHGTPAP